MVAMSSCPSCSAPAESSARFCLECGHAFDEESVGADDPWLGRMVAGRFRIEEKLGEGGMGEVYRAEQLPMGRPVALKLLRQSLSDNPEQVERFKREAQAASQLKSPHTIIVHDFGQDVDGTLFLAMEYLEGTPLNELLDSEGALAPDRAVRIMARIAQSVQEAHGIGVIHRDLKPENIFLTVREDDADFVKVLDFGIAKVSQTQSGGKLDTITRAGAIFGTPQYMAPEQIRGSEIDARADIYALGVMLYQMISGHLPFAANTVVEMLTQHLNAEPLPIEGTSSDTKESLARLEAVALRALSKEPEQRQPTARAFLEDLMAALPNFSLNRLTGLVPATAMGAPSVSVIAAPAQGRSTSTAMLLAAVLAAGFAGAFFYLNGGGQGQGPSPESVAPIVLMQDADKAGGDAPVEQKAEDKAAEAAAEVEAKKAEDDAKKAEAEADKPLDPEEAKKIAAASEAEAKQAEADQAKAEADKKAAAEAEKKAAAEGKKKAAEEKKAVAAADKKAAEEKKAAAAAVKKAEAAAKAEATAATKKVEAEKQAAEAKAKAEALAAAKIKEEAAKAKADAAKADDEKKAAKAEAATAKKERIAAEKAAKKAQATADKAIAKAKAGEEKAAKIKAESDVIKAKADAIKAESEKIAAQAAAVAAENTRMKAELQKLVDEKAAAEAAAAEAIAKKKAARARAKAARKGKRSKKKTCKVIVQTKTRGVTILVNGKNRGRSPKRAFTLKAGSYKITGKKGRKKASRKIRCRAGKVARAKLNI